MTDKIRVQHPWEIGVDQTTPPRDPLQALARWLTLKSVDPLSGMSTAIAPFARGWNAKFMGQNTAMPRTPLRKQIADNEFMRQWTQINRHQRSGRPHDLPDYVESAITPSPNILVDSGPGGAGGWGLRLKSTAFPPSHVDALDLRDSLWQSLGPSHRWP